MKQLAVFLCLLFSIIPVFAQKLVPLQTLNNTTHLNTIYSGI